MPNLYLGGAKSLFNFTSSTLGLLSAISFLVIFSSCQKETDQPVIQSERATISNKGVRGHLQQTQTYPADVAIAWINMQIRLMRASGLGNTILIRPYAYCGVALYETVVAGMPAYQSVASQLNGLSGLPQTEHGFAYHWPSSANAALAFVNKHMFSTTSAANKAAIDSLENVLNLQYQNEANAETISRSIAFGRAVAQRVFDWSETDGYLHAGDPYTPPAGPGLWVPTPAAFANAATPYFGNLRTIVPGSGHNSQPDAPFPYSTDASSDFYKMVKQVYDVSQTLTPQQTAQALWWRDNPGTASAHYLNILSQALKKENSSLDIAAYGWALSGITAFDAYISCWQTKFQYNLVRPITYIRTVLGYASWSPLIGTPAHPEYSAAHATVSSAYADAMTMVFGANFSITDNTYNFLGMASRSFSSFKALGEDAGNSRLFAGIHYQHSIDIGLEQGRKVAENIISELKFLKE